MGWASHGGCISKLPAHIQVVMGIRAFTDAPDLAVQAEPSGVEKVPRSTAHEGGRDVEHVERKVFLVFSSSQEMFYREVLLSLGESRPLGMLVSCHVCVGDPGCVIIILPSYVGSLHW